MKKSLVALTLAAGALLTGCSNSGDQSATPSPTPTVTASASPTRAVETNNTPAPTEKATPAKTPNAETKAFVAKLADANSKSKIKTMHSTMVANGFNYDGVIDNSDPQKIKQYAKITGNTNVEVLQIGADAYEKQNGKWVKMPAGTAPASSPDLAEIIKKNPNFISSAKQVGKNQYQITSNPGSGQSATYTVTVDDQFRVIKMADKGMTITQGNFNEKVDIPDPTK